MSDETDETRVVLVKPGELLLIGNVGDIHNPEAAVASINGLFKEFGVRAALFAADIDISKVTR